jgi:WD40 repeat protein
MFAFSPDSKRLAWQGKIWDAATGSELFTLKKVADTTGNIEIAAFSPDGKRVVGEIVFGTPVVDQILPPRAYGVWNAETGELLFTTSVIAARGLLTPPTFSPDGTRLAGACQIWDAQTGQFLLTLVILRGQVAFSEDGHRLAAIPSWTNEVTIYDATPLP